MEEFLFALGICLMIAFLIIVFSIKIKEE